MPPSNNASYDPVIIKGVARQKLSKVAKDFQRNFKEYLTQNYFDEINNFQHSNECVYKLTIITNFKDLYTTSKTAKHPYKRKDVLWAGKLIQDLFKGLLGNDDLYDFQLNMWKGDLQDDSVEIIFSATTLEEHLKEVREIRNAQEN